MRDHDGVASIARRCIEQLPNQLSPRFFFWGGEFIKDREILRRRPFAEGELPGVDASAIRAGHHRANRNIQALECHTDVLGRLPPLFIEISLARAILVVVSALAGDIAVRRHMAHQNHEPALPERLDEFRPLQTRLESLTLRVRLTRGKQENGDCNSRQDAQVISKLRSVHGCDINQYWRRPTAGGVNPTARRLPGYAFADPI